jgi:hypothetical protein
MFPTTRGSVSPPKQVRLQGSSQLRPMRRRVLGTQWHRLANEGLMNSKRCDCHCRRMVPKHDLASRIDTRTSRETRRNRSGPKLRRMHDGLSTKNHRPPSPEWIWHQSSSAVLLATNLPPNARATCNHRAYVPQFVRRDGADSKCDIKIMVLSNKCGPGRWKLLKASCGFAAPIWSNFSRLWTPPADLEAID